MTCENCIHYEVCCEWNEKFIKHRMGMGDGCVCKNYKDKSLFVELPCKVGDTIYIIDLFDYEPCKKKGENGDVCPHLYAEYGFGYECLKGKFGVKPFECAEIKAVKIKDISQIFNHWKDFGKTVFLTKEEAERKLREVGE